MKTHYLKTLPEYFNESWHNKKTFEVRKNDRHFQNGDTVILQEYNQSNDTYTGREIKGTILYLLNDFPALKEGYVVFSFWGVIFDENLKSE